MAEKQKHLALIAHEIWMSDADSSIAIWVKIVNAVIAEHERRKAASNERPED